MVEARPYVTALTRLETPWASIIWKMLSAEVGETGGKVV
jgi:hypothetical protein